MNKLFILVFALLFSACNQNVKEKDLIDSVKTVICKLYPERVLEKELLVLIIPFDGCSTCFEEAIFLIPLIEERHGLIIFPEIHSRRVYNYLEEIGINKESVLVDTMRLSMINGLIDYNPMLYMIRNDSLIYSELVDVSTIDTIINMISMK